jgi:hypothetical protein
VTIANQRDPASPPTLVYLFGPPAVGKMTVGQELSRRTGFRLFHHHQILDLLSPYFEFGTRSFDRLNAVYRTQFFAEAAESGVDLITTGGWAFDLPAETDPIWNYVRPYVERMGRVYFVELLAPLDVRLERNRTENRRLHKRTDWATDDYLRRWDGLYRQDSGGTIPFELPFLRLETSDLSIDATVERICAAFNLPRSAVS